MKLGNNEKTASRDQGDSDSVTALEAQMTGLTLVSSSARCCCNLNFTVWYKPSPAPTSTAQPSTLPPPPALPVCREDSSLERYPVPPEETIPGRRAGGDSKILQPTLQRVLLQAAAMLVARDGAFTSVVLLRRSSSLPDRSNSSSVLSF
ncbi:hypothetical protein NQZ68_028284, partial [Dissostichus eleginoides]